VVSKSGSFFSYGNERIGQGRNNAKAYLVENPEVAREIEEKVYAALGIERDAPPPLAPVEDAPVDVVAPEAEVEKAA
jgi:recombination protein RecA